MEKGDDYCALIIVNSSMNFSSKKNKPLIESNLNCSIVCFQFLFQIKLKRKAFLFLINDQCQLYCDALEIDGLF